MAHEPPPSKDLSVSSHVHIHLTVTVQTPCTANPAQLHPAREGQAAVLKTRLSPHRKKSSLYHAFEVNKTEICVLSISYVAVNEDQILFSTFSLKTGPQYMGYAGSSFGQ